MSGPLRGVHGGRDSWIPAAAALVLLLQPAPAVAEPVPVPVDPYAGCPTVIYYTVPAAGSTGLFEIAEDVLGDPLRATEIYEYTEGRVQPDSGVLTSDQEVRPGGT